MKLMKKAGKVRNVVKNSLDKSSIRLNAIWRIFYKRLVKLLSDQDIYVEITLLVIFLNPKTYAMNYHLTRNL